MVYLYSIKDDCMICDFTFIYESDCKLMLDIYAYGAKKEPKCLNIDLKVNVLDTGLISVSREDYDRLCLRRREVMNDEENLYNFSIKAVNAAKKMVNECNKMEMKNWNLTKKDIKNTMSILESVVGYRELSDKASELLASKLGIKRIKELNLPSYLSITSNNFDLLNKDSDENEFIRFAEEYGYLYTFNIAKNKYEEIDMLKEMVKNKKGKSSKKVSILSIKYDCKNEYTQTEKIFYNFSWYSEVKHIYQLRILRNLRRYMEKHNLNVYKTDTRSLLTYVH